MDIRKCRVMLFGLSFFANQIIYAQQDSQIGQIADEGYKVVDPDKKHLEKIKSNPHLIIDSVNTSGYEVYGPEGLRAWFETQNIPIIDLPIISPFDKELSRYQNTDEMYTFLDELEKIYPDILSFYSIGQSVDGRELMVMKISDNPTKIESEPRIKFIANMHGDEVVGRELLIKFIEQISQRYQAGDTQIKYLVENSEIYIMPTMNPDGFERRRRSNANGYDLNRNFPNSTTNNLDSTANKQPETKAVMTFETLTPSALSANFHGGAVVVNYPWDNMKAPPPHVDLIKDLSLTYSKNNIDMYTSREFLNGITNGYRWYSINGSLQDWSYYYRDNLNLTLEVSNTKFPPYSEIEGLWQANEKSLNAYLAKVHQGLGFSFIEEGMTGDVEIINDASLKTESKKFYNSYFYKILPIGSYTLKIKPSNGIEQVIKMQVDGLMNKTNGNIRVLTTQ